MYDCQPVVLAELIVQPARATTARAKLAFNRLCVLECRCTINGGGEQEAWMCWLIRSLIPSCYTLRGVHQRARFCFPSPPGSFISLAARGSLFNLPEPRKRSLSVIHSIEHHVFTFRCFQPEFPFQCPQVLPSARVSYHTNAIFPRRNCCPTDPILSH